MKTVDWKRARQLFDAALELYRQALAEDDAAAAEWFRPSRGRACCRICSTIHLS